MNDKRGIGFFEALPLRLGSPYVFAVPLILRTILIFFYRLRMGQGLKLPHNVAAPAVMIGASNFFELSVAVVASPFGLQSRLRLLQLWEYWYKVPVMLTLVKFANNTRKYFKN